MLSAWRLQTPKWNSTAHVKLVGYFIGSSAFRECETQIARKQPSASRASKLSQSFVRIGAAKRKIRAREFRWMPPIFLRCDNLSRCEALSVDCQFLTLQSRRSSHAQSWAWIIFQIGVDYQIEQAHGLTSRESHPSRRYFEQFRSLDATRHFPDFRREMNFCS